MITIKLGFLSTWQFMWSFLLQLTSNFPSLRLDKDLLKDASWYHGYSSQRCRIRCTTLYNVSTSEYQCGFVSVTGFRYLPGSAAQATLGKHYLHCQMLMMNVQWSLLSHIKEQRSWSLSLSSLWPRLSATINLGVTGVQVNWDTEN